jgi:hypothetical protein
MIQGGEDGPMDVNQGTRKFGVEQTCQKIRTSETNKDDYGDPNRHGLRQKIVVSPFCSELTPL